MFLLGDAHGTRGDRNFIPGDYFFLHVSMGNLGSCATFAISVAFLVENIIVRKVT